MDMILTGSGNDVHGHLLLPQGASAVDRVIIDGVATDFRISHIEHSVYFDFNLSLPSVHTVNVSYR